LSITVEKWKQIYFYHLIRVLIEERRASLKRNFLTNPYRVSVAGGIVDVTLKRVAFPVRRSRAPVVVSTMGAVVVSTMGAAVVSTMGVVLVWAEVL
jgi:hypothetical protein